MRHTITDQALVAAGPEACAAVAADVSGFHHWAPGVVSAVSVDRDDKGRAVVADLVIEAGGRSVTCRIALTHESDSVSWRLLESDLLNLLEGEGSFQELGPDRTEARWSITVESLAPVPPFVSRRNEAALRRALTVDFVHHVEMTAQGSVA